MAEIGWIKLSVDLFENQKMRYLRRCYGSGALLLWVYMLTLAGKCNDGGRLILSKTIAISSEMLSKDLGLSKSKTEQILESMRELEMIHLDGECMVISGWGKHQSIESMEKIREQNRLRKQQQRDRERASRDAHVTVTAQKREEKKREEKEEREKRESAAVTLLKLYREHCVALPALNKMTGAEQDKAEALMGQYDEKELESLFYKAGASSFLRGENKSGWKASLGWLLEPDNALKVLRGDYDDATEAVDPREMALLQKFYEEYGND